MTPLIKGAPFSELPLITSSSGKAVTIHGKEYLQFCSDDFLGLATDRRLRASAMAGVERDGFGLSATPLSGGRRSCHERLERKLSLFFYRSDCILFNNIQLAWAALLRCLTSSHDVLFVDRLVAQPIQSALSQSMAKVVFFPHRDLEALEGLMARASSSSRRIVLTESVFFTDGSVAPLGELNDLVRRLGGELLLDESSAFGILGTRGSGRMEQLGMLGHDVHTVVAFDRACGATGAAVLTSAAVGMSLRTADPQYLFETPLLPPVTYAIETAVDIIESGLTDRGKLAENGVRLSDALAKMRYKCVGSGLPIVPLFVQKQSQLKELERALFERGILVAEGTSPATNDLGPFLRLTVMATHTIEEIAHLLQTLEDLGKRLHILH